MKRIIVIIILVLINSIMFAEYTFQYAPQNGNATDFATSHISSDFGRRYDTDTKWHKGVDYVRPHGSHLLALDDGEIQSIYCTQTNNWEYKIIKINGDSLDYGYGHIFYDGEPSSSGILRSGMRLKSMSKRAKKS